MIEKQPGKLKRQAGDFPQRGKSPYSSARSPLRGTVPARLRMPSSSGYQEYSRHKYGIGFAPFIFIQESGKMIGHNESQMT
jgi:hypothetical protein